MVRMSIKSLCKIGVEFIEYLSETNRISVTNRHQLKDIYNQEFRIRNERTKDPRFGSILYALKVSNKITRRGDVIRLQTKVREVYLDQWHTKRSSHPQTARSGAASPDPALPLASADGAETGVRARRDLACLLMKKIRENRNHLITDRNGIIITSDHQFENGKLRFDAIDTYESSVILNVENRGTETVHFTYYTALHWLRYFSLTDEHKVTRTNPLTLKPGDDYEIQINFCCSLVGLYPATLAFEFSPDVQSSFTMFHIVRFIEAQCMTSFGRELEPVAPYKPSLPPKYTFLPDCKIVEGQRPEGQSVIRLKNVVELKKYPLPGYMTKLIQYLKSGTPFPDKSDLLESPLSLENYSQKFQLLLHLEEEQLQVDIRRYNIPNRDREDHASMTRDPKNKKLLILEVPDVSENRPSVLRGDQLLVYPAGETGVKYRGYVHSVELDRVKLGFGSELLDRFVDGMKFNVEFTVNRVPVRVEHRAAELASTHSMGNVLFPTKPTSASQEPELPRLTLFDQQLEKNPEQHQAIRHIVAGSSKPAPYLVFGPPGTGKTVTLVEAIKQIEKLDTFCHILVCAPSNSAADLLCTRIREHVDVHKVYRMYASSRDPKCVPDVLKACSNLEGDCYVFPEKNELMKYKILVTTLITAGRLVTGNIPKGHFTHVFVDEAGHAVETECLVPLAGLLQAETGQVVLAGDPKQLGPIIRSPFALKYGMGMSLLERLMTNFALYQKEEGVYNNRFVTKLLRNYRSHPAILKVPNDLFYDGELKVCAAEMKCNSYCRWEHLRKPGFPVIFHGVTGIDEREATSPSFFNVAEVAVLMDYVRKLLQTDGKKGLSTILPKDIGIIAPYRKQVQKIRKALDKVGKEFKSKDMSTLKVGSVEEFQGQERRVILVTTVRSSRTYADIDKKFCIGFVKNQKRFNVAVTRAMALLIVVGNPVVLREDPVWGSFLKYCRDEGGYDGYKELEEHEDVIMRLSTLYTEMKLEVEMAESVVQQHQEPRWRNDP